MTQEELKSRLQNLHSEVADLVGDEGIHCDSSLYAYLSCARMSLLCATYSASDYDVDSANFNI